jgi:hypothetical protein
VRISSFLFLIFFLSCERNAITGRRQLNLFPEADLQKQGLSENKAHDLAQKEEEKIFGKRAE